MDNLGEWAGAVGSVVVAAVAVGVVFLQRRFDRQREIGRISSYSTSACAVALQALAVISDLQHDLYERTRTRLGGQNRDWRFDLMVAHATVHVGLQHDIFDPNLLVCLVAVRAWAADTLTLVELEPNPALLRLQASTIAREEAKKALLQMMERLL
jgi:hypothetical protein